MIVMGIDPGLATLGWGVISTGAIARKVVPGLSVRAALVQIGRHRIDRANWDWAEVENNPFFAPDAASF